MLPSSDINQAIWSWLRVEYLSFSFGGNHLSNNQISSILVFDFLLQFFGDMVSLLATLDRAQFLYWTMNEFGIGHTLS